MLVYVDLTGPMNNVMLVQGIMRGCSMLWAPMCVNSLDSIFSVPFLMPLFSNCLAFSVFYIG